MTTKTIFTGIIIITALLVGGLFLLQSVSVDPEAQGNAVFELSFTDYKGNGVSLADFTGKPLVVNTWASWCPFCVDELSAFAALQREFPEALVVAINRAESLKTAQSYSDGLGETGEDLMFWLDSSDSFYRTIGGFSMPETLFIDSAGVVQDHKRGPMELEEMRQRMQKIL